MEAGKTVIVVEHDTRVIAASDRVIDIGPGGGEERGRVVASGAPAEVSKATGSRTAPYLARFFGALPDLNYFAACDHGGTMPFTRA